MRKIVDTPVVDCAASVKDLYISMLEGLFRRGEESPMVVFMRECREAFNSVTVPNMMEPSSKLHERCNRFTNPPLDRWMDIYKNTYEAFPSIPPLLEKAYAACKAKLDGASGSKMHERAVKEIDSFIKSGGILTEDEASRITPPVTLTHEELFVYLGRFKIRVSRCLLKDCLDNPSGDRLPRITCDALEPVFPKIGSHRCHPHVSDGGPPLDRGICLGEAKPLIREAVKTGNLLAIFDLVESVLMTYNHNGPYQPLATWVGFVCDNCGALWPREEDLTTVTLPALDPDDDDYDTTEDPDEERVVECCKKCKDKVTR
jgi:hypothetical protein